MDTPVNTSSSPALLPAQELRVCVTCEQLLQPTAFSRSQLAKANAYVCEKSILLMKT